MFLTVENLKVCESVFERYMLDRYNVDVRTRERNVRRLLYSIMVDVDTRMGRDANITVRQLNDITMGLARDVYLVSDAPTPTHRTDPPPTRSTNVPPILPSRPKSGEAIDSKTGALRTFEKLMQQRRQEYDVAQGNRPVDLPVEMHPTRVTPEDSDRFMRVLEDLSKERENNVVPPPPPPTPTPTDLPPQPPSSSSMDDKKLDPDVMASNDAPAIVVPTTHRPPTALLNGGGTFFHTRYLSVNGADREWPVEPLRFRFTARAATTGSRSMFRNVHALKVSRVVLPMEIAVRETLHEPSKPSFQNAFSFAFPYVLLSIAGFEDVYDATNDAARQSFCHLIFDRQYKAPNGRGYVVLEAMQHENKVFAPAPLASLPNLTLSLQKPNGTLFNNSRDDFAVVKVEHDAYNTAYFKIVLDKYFDRNEFYVGDTVNFSRFAFTESATVLALGNALPTSSALDILQVFINRSEGHEIVELGNANDSGFYRSFYIGAPGSLDQEAGRVTIDTYLIDNLNAYNTEVPVSSDLNQSGYVINTSLQITVAFTVTVMTPGDARSVLAPTPI